jgi:alkanesulfonate monooxygenase SsuD/methylene tetrahydromethanopterin reductase-like flavin-dependent oxidoreductase (luciferase family)
MAPSFHLFLPQMRMTHEAIVERALAAEAAGFEGISFMDHLAPPMALDQDMWEAMSIAAWVLAHTSTLKVGHLVLCDSFRHPAVLARQATSLDHASHGRFELGIGWGSVPVELEVFGVGSTEAPVRVGRLAETLEILRGLWSGEVVDHHGAHFTLEGAQQLPTPTAPIPITIGGVGKRTLALVREHAEWWNLPIHELERLDELRGQVGDARVSVQAMVALVPDEPSRDDVTALVRRRFGRGAMGRNLAIGTPDELVGHFGALADRGVERFHVWFADFAPVETLERFAAVVAEVITADR